MSLRIASLVKQIPAFEEMTLGPDGRLRREGVDLEMNAYCRRAVAQAVALAAEHGGEVTVLTLGPPDAEDTLREALAWADSQSVDATAVLVTDPAFAGSDTLATAKALSAALRAHGPFDLILSGRNSVDADTGQVGPEVAELLDLPFATAVRYLAVEDDGILDARCEHDDGWVQLRMQLPAVLSCAERLVDPCKVDPDGRATVSTDRIHRVSASELGPGPWGEAASPTRVGRVRLHNTPRDRMILEGSLAETVPAAVDAIEARGALSVGLAEALDPVPPPASSDDTPAVVVIVEPVREVPTRELLGRAAQLARDLGGHVVAIGTDLDAGLAPQGADVLVHVDAGAAPVEEDVAGAVVQWARSRSPWAILAPGTAWGREVASRVAVRLDAGLTGDAVALECVDGRLTAWKPAFGGQLVAEITTRSPVQLATVRAGVLDHLLARDPSEPVHDTIVVEARGRARVLARTRDDDLDVLAEADVVVGVGQAVPPDAYPMLDELLHVLGAELAATRKVTDRGWLPRARQVGITGRSIDPRLYVGLGLGGKFNHMVGVRRTGTILAVNSDRDAPVFDAVDVGIVGDWRAVVPVLTAELERAINRRSTPAPR